MAHSVLRATFPRLAAQAGVDLVVFCRVACLDRVGGGQRRGELFARMRFRSSNLQARVGRFLGIAAA
jgi:hypothetical protein